MKGLFGLDMSDRIGVKQDCLVVYLTLVLARALELVSRGTLTFSCRRFSEFGCSSFPDMYVRSQVGKAIWEPQKLRSFQDSLN
jgi:hypothetical protein